MYKLIIASVILALAAAAPAPHRGLLTYSSPVLSPVVVSPGVTSYSGYSNGVVHGSPVSLVPVVQQQVVHQPLLQQPLVHSVPLTYSAHVPTVLVN